MEYKYIITSDNDPYKNLAIEQYLFQFAKSGQAILYLWQNHHTIVIGKNQNIYSECKVAEFEASGGKIARRKSGGGAVYHDLGNLNFSIICKTTDVEKSPYQIIVIRALEQFGLYADFNGRNDLLMNDRKFSGNAFYNNGTVFCQHGTVLIASDINKMTYFLTPEAGKLEKNHVKSISSRVVNLSEISPDISVKNMQQAMIEAVKAVELDWKVNEKDLKDGIKMFSKREWIYGGIE